MNIKKESTGNETFMFGTLPITCMMLDTDSFHNFIYRINIAIKLLAPIHKLIPNPVTPNDKKSRRKADKAFAKLYSLIVEIHKLCFNVHYIMAQLEVNEWGLTSQEFNHLFHEVRDGSWSLEKLLDDTLDGSETFRKYILILDVYSKVFIDDLFTNWRSLVQHVGYRKRAELAQDMMAFQNNFCGLKSKYDHFKYYGYVPKPPIEDIQRHYIEKKRQYFETNQGNMSPTTAKTLKEVFGDEFFKANFQTEGEYATHVTFTEKVVLVDDIGEEELHLPVVTSSLVQKFDSLDLEVSDDADIEVSDAEEAEDVDVEVCDDIVDIEVYESLDFEETEELDVEVCDDMVEIEVYENLHIEIEVSDEADNEISDEEDIEECAELETQMRGTSDEVNVEISDEPEKKRMMWRRMYFEEESDYVEEKTVQEDDCQNSGCQNEDAETVEIEEDTLEAGSCASDDKSEEYFTGTDE